MHITNWGVRGREGEGKGGGGGDGSHKKKGGWVGYTSGSSKSYLGDFSYIFMVYPRGVIPPGTLWAVFIEILIDSARMIETLSLLIFTPVDSLGFFRILFFFSSLCHLGTGRGGGGRRIAGLQERRRGWHLRKVAVDGAAVDQQVQSSHLPPDNDGHGQIYE